MPARFPTSVSEGSWERTYNSKHDKRKLSSVGIILNLFTRTVKQNWSQPFTDTVF